MQTDSLAFCLRFYGNAQARAWLTSLAYTYRRGGDLIYLLEGPDNVVSADRILEAGEREGLLERGKLDFDHNLRAFTALTLGGIKNGPMDPKHAAPRYFAWTLTEAGREHFTFKGRIRRSSVR